MTASTLEMALTYEHENIRELAAPAQEPAAARPDRRHETDWFYAIAAQHLAAAEDVLLPHVRRLPDGRNLVADYVDNARQLERSLRFLKARQYGDSRVIHLHPEEVWQVIDRLLDEHEQLEAEYGRMISEELDSERISDLTEELLSAEEVAPTRAHPYSPHTGTAGRLRPTGCGGSRTPHGTARRDAWCRRSTTCIRNGTRPCPTTCAAPRSRRTDSDRARNRRMPPAARARPETLPHCAWL